MVEFCWHFFWSGTFCKHSFLQHWVQCQENAFEREGKATFYVNSWIMGTSETFLFKISKQTYDVRWSVMNIHKCEN